MTLNNFLKLKNILKTAYSLILNIMLKKKKKEKSILCIQQQEETNFLGCKCCYCPIVEGQ